MRFTYALLSASVAALELPSYFFNRTENPASAGTYINSKAEDWATTYGSALTDSTFLSSRFNNRMRWGPAANHPGKLNDRRGFVASVAAGNNNGTQTTANMNWFGGCYLKPSKDYEAYFNDYNSGGRFHAYTTVGDAAPTNAPAFENKKLTGLVTYRCYDTAAGTDATTTQDCEFAAKARGFTWDQLNQRAQLKLDLYRPYVVTTNTIDYDGTNGVEADETAQAIPGQYGLTDNCLVPKITAGDNTVQDAGLLTDIGANVYKMDQATLPAPATKFEYAQSHFSLELTNFLDDIEMNDSNVNNRLTEASVRLTYKLGTLALNNGAPVTHALAQASATYPDALSGLTAEPSIGCCKLESWSMRTFKRAAERIKTEQTRMCEYSTVHTFTTTGLTTATAARPGIDACDVTAVIA